MRPFPHLAAKALALAVALQSMPDAWAIKVTTRIAGPSHTTLAKGHAHYGGWTEKARSSSQSYSDLSKHLKLGTEATRRELSAESLVSIAILKDVYPSIYQEFFEGKTPAKKAQAIKFFDESLAQRGSIPTDESRNTIPTTINGAGPRVVSLPEWRAAVMNSNIGEVPRLDPTSEIQLRGLLKRAHMKSEGQNVWEGDLIRGPAHLIVNEVDRNSRTRRPAALEITEFTGDNSRTNSIRIAVPGWDFPGVSTRVLANRMSRVTADIPPNVPVLVSSSNLSRPLPEIFPGRTVLRTYDPTGRFVSDSQRNLENLMRWKPTRSGSVLFNAVPSTFEHVRLINQSQSVEDGVPRRLRGTVDDWRAAHETISRAAARVAQLAPEVTRNAIFRAIAVEKIDTIIVVAHGDEKHVYLPNGEYLSVSDFVGLLPSHRDPPPVVILISCNTGAAHTEGLTTFAQALLQSGRATAVVAPASEVRPTLAVVEEIERFMLQASETNAADALQNLKAPFQVFVNKTTH